MENPFVTSRLCKRFEKRCWRGLLVVFSPQQLRKYFFFFASNNLFSTLRVFIALFNVALDFSAYTGHSLASRCSRNIKFSQSWAVARISREKNILKSSEIVWAHRAEKIDKTRCEAGTKSGGKWKFIRENCSFSRVFPVTRQKNISVSSIRWTVLSN